MTTFIRVISILFGVLPGFILLLGGSVVIYASLSSLVSSPELYMNDLSRLGGILAAIVVCLIGFPGYVGLVSVSFGGILTNRRVLFLWLGILSVLSSFVLVFGGRLFSVGFKNDNIADLIMWAILFFGPVTVALYHLLLLKRAANNNKG